MRLRLPSSITAAALAAGLAAVMLAPAGGRAAANQAQAGNQAQAADQAQAANRAQAAPSGPPAVSCPGGGRRGESGRLRGEHRAAPGALLPVGAAGFRPQDRRRRRDLHGQRVRWLYPCNLRAAYELTALSAKDGTGNTIAVVDPGDDPNAAADLNVYRSTYGMAQCTTKNPRLEKLNQDGVAGSYPAPDAGDAQEMSLDLDIVSAICPKCHILLVEANSNGFGDLGTAINEAVTLGAKVVSDSWGTGEFNGENGWDGNVDHPGVAITFRSGDDAYIGGVQYPSSSPYVTPVGGTQLTPATNSHGWTEKAWVTPGTPPTQGSGSGCSAYEPKPPWQKDAGCAARTAADVSAVAANVLSYDTYMASGWYFSFGTSVSSPIIAGLYGLANTRRASRSPPPPPMARPPPACTTSPRAAPGPVRRQRRPGTCARRPRATTARPAWASRTASAPSRCPAPRRRASPR